jgi:fimbrial chaperone protein
MQRRWKSHFHVPRATARLGARRTLLGLALAWSGLAAHAAEYSISPVALQFTPGMRAGVLGINNSDQRPIRFQLSLVEWTQNAKGEDVYLDSEDLVFFPRQITVAPGAQSVARVGPKSGLPDIEKSYRLRVEELPEPLAQSPGNTLALTSTYAIPVFLGTPESAAKAVIDPLQLAQGKLTATVHNRGSAHFRIESLELQGANGYTDRMGGWYLLPGARRDYVFAIAPEVCKAQHQLQLQIKVGEQLFMSALAVDPNQCGS